MQLVGLRNTSEKDCIIVEQNRQLMQETIHRKHSVIEENHNVTHASRTKVNMLSLLLNEFTLAVRVPVEWSYHKWDGSHNTVIFSFRECINLPPKMIMFPNFGDVTPFTLGKVFDACPPNLEGPLSMNSQVQLHKIGLHIVEFWRRKQSGKLGVFKDIQWSRNYLYSLRECKGSVTATLDPLWYSSHLKVKEEENWARAKFRWICSLNMRECEFGLMDSKKCMLRLLTSDTSHEELARRPSRLLLSWWKTLF